MHQGHNIPWNIISTNFKFVRNDTSFTPPVTGLISKKRPSTPKELKHFIKKFVTAIHTFSETERIKYPANITPGPSGNLFSDELRIKHPDYLNIRNQRLEYWIARAPYTNLDGDLADVIKVLLYENEMETLLMLAQHPLIPIERLDNIGWGHHFGFNRVMESALHVYMFFNVAEATGILENGEYASIQPLYQILLREIADGMDYPAQQIPHLEFLAECGVLEPRETHSLVHMNYGRLQEYLKVLFALIYRYDVLVRECGLSSRWEQEMGYQWPLTGTVKLEWDASGLRYVLA